MTAKAMGRPSKYRPEFVEQAKKLCRLGATDLEIADFFDVELPEFAQWAWDHKEFFDAITPNQGVVTQWNDEDASYRKARSEAKKKRFEKNPSERINNCMRARMWAALRGKTSGKCLSRLAYSTEELKLHLEKLFSAGMSWENYGKWHIDHIKPCASFDLTDKAQFDECWSIDNLQPLWASDNIKKGARYGGS